MIRDEATFLARLHAALDARRDPFADGELLAWLDAHPEQLDRTARLCADARALAALRTPRRRPMVAIASALAAAGLLGVATLVAMAGDDTRSPCGRILAADLVEQRPRAWLAASYSVSEVLVADGRAHLVVSRLHSQPR